MAIDNSVKLKRTIDGIAKLFIGNAKDEKVDKSIGINLSTTYVIMKLMMPWINLLRLYFNIDMFFAL